jgi:hypothetical protein
MNTRFPQSTRIDINLKDLNSENCIQALQLQNLEVPYQLIVFCPVNARMDVGGYANVFQNLSPLVGGHLIFVPLLNTMNPREAEVEEIFKRFPIKAHTTGAFEWKQDTTGLANDTQVILNQEVLLTDITNALNTRIAQ